MTALLWFLLGIWVGATAGFALFACLQVSRDGERVSGETIRPRVLRLPIDAFAFDGP